MHTVCRHAAARRAGAAAGRAVCGSGRRPDSPGRRRARPLAGSRVRTRPGVWRHVRGSARLSGRRQDCGVRPCRFRRCSGARAAGAAPPGGQAWARGRLLAPAVSRTCRSCASHRNAVVYYPVLVQPSSYFADGQPGFPGHGRFSSRSDGFFRPFCTKSQAASSFGVAWNAPASKSFLRPRRPRDPAQRFSSSIEHPVEHLRVLARYAYGGHGRMAA